MEEDRISQLPEPILQNHILSLLPQNDAVRTCVLSKSWRHLGLTRPKIEFDEFSFPESQKEKFISVVDNTLQRYEDQNLTIQEFVLKISLPAEDSALKNDSISLLDKWIPIVIMNRGGVKTFKLTAYGFSLPLVVFQAEFLEELYLQGYELLNQINKNCIFNLQVLKRLSLWQVNIEDETFEKIISSCPLIECLDLVLCLGLSTTKVNKASNLKHLCFYSFCSFDARMNRNPPSFEINDAPNLETIYIKDCEKWKRPIFFPRLKSLILRKVHLPRGFLNNLSRYCPCLEVLDLDSCPGLIRVSKISNLSITRLVISIPYSKNPFKAAIDVPNMLHFEFTSIHIPSISFAKTSREWKSVINVGSFTEESTFDVDPNADWPLKLHEFLKALSQSQISSLKIYHLPLTNQDTYDGGSSCDPAVVENLCLGAHYPSSEIPAFLNCLFRMCRPRNIQLSLPTLSLTDLQHKENESQLAESIWKILEKKEGTRQCNFWQQDLEKSSIHVWDKNTNAWQHVQAVCALSINQSICFLCCWNKKCLSKLETNKR